MNYDIPEIEVFVNTYGLNVRVDGIVSEYFAEYLKSTFNQFVGQEIKTHTKYDIQNKISRDLNKLVCEGKLVNINNCWDIKGFVWVD